MSLATTTLSSAVTTTDTSIVVASATSMAAGRLILIDQEMMQVGQGYTSGTTVPVLRGREGSANLATSHKATANVTHGTAQDFNAPPAQSYTGYPLPRSRQIISLTATSTLTLPTAGEDMLVILNGTSAITLTIPVPTKDMDGCTLTIAGNGAAAHLYTFTGGLNGAGSSYDIVTGNAGPIPFLMQVTAVNGAWMVPCCPAMGGTVTNLIGSVA